MVIQTIVGHIINCAEGHEWMKEIRPSLERYPWAPRHVRLENSWMCSNELIKVINVICIISLQEVEKLHD